MDDEKKTILWLGIAVFCVLQNIAVRGYFNYKEKQEFKSYESAVETFDIGEHIISVPIDNPKKEIQTYEYHDGYKVIDIENNYILYVNDEPVKCIGYIDNNEEVHFIEFGEPVENENTKTESKTYKLVPQEQLTTEE